MAATLFGHYTTASALIQILKTEQLWATNIKFLNDEQEFFHALDLIEGIIKARKLPEKDPRTADFNAFTTDVGKALGTLDRFRTERIFTVSFSEEIDLLSQWRGYCPNNDGYCIVFDAEALVGRVQKEIKGCSLEACVYDNKEKAALLKAMLNRYFPTYRAATPGKGRRAVLEQLTEELQRLACYFKHPTFAEEKERRIIVDRDWEDGSLPSEFRAGKFGVVPYVRIPAPKDFIKKIIIGPTAQPKLAIRAIEHLAETVLGLPLFILNIEISNSKIPFRA